MVGDPLSAGTSGIVLQVAGFPVVKLVLIAAAIAAAIVVLKVVIGFTARIVYGAGMALAVLGALWVVSPEAFNRVVDTVTGLL
ncbi:hypothetical protein [Halorhabdus rudnickae]|uniref:hypothetical protein n=1 Tax=Halorhabdus rudnickae TaxID=1775544 RepID=UPI00108455EB|nr:hypothetical protein [Halorhabdus rudnickae]